MNSFWWKVALLNVRSEQYKERIAMFCCISMMVGKESSHGSNWLPILILYVGLILVGKCVEMNFKVIDGLPDLQKKHQI